LLGSNGRFFHNTWEEAALWKGDKRALKFVIIVGAG